MLPPASSDLPDTRPGRPIVVHLSEFGLASDGVYMAADVTTGTVVSYTAFSPFLGRGYAALGWYISVALAWESPPPDVIRHPAL